MFKLKGPATTQSGTGAVPANEELAIPTRSDERSIGSLPAGFFDDAATSGGFQVLLVLFLLRFLIWEFKISATLLRGCYTSFIA